MREAAERLAMSSALVRPVQRHAMASEGAGPMAKVFGILLTVGMMSLISGIVQFARWLMLVRSVEELIAVRIRFCKSICGADEEEGVDFVMRAVEGLCMYF